MRNQTRKPNIYVFAALAAVVPAIDIYLGVGAYHRGHPMGLITGVGVAMMMAYLVYSAARREQARKP
jgi:hypothetical protein